MNGVTAKLTETLAARLGSSARVAITGCGGKTSLMIALAKQYAQQGCSVLVTTTTKLRNPYELDYGCDVIQLDTFSHTPHAGERVFFASTMKDPVIGRQKVCAPNFSVLSDISRLFDIVLMEADGSRGIPLKYHNPWDPVVPDFTTDVLAVVGMSALDGPLDDRSIFNYSEYREATSDTSSIVSERTIQNLLMLGEGICKGFGGRRGTVFFNQCDMLNPGRLTSAIEKIGEEYLYGSVKKNIVYGGNRWISL